jgi:hypothetical protein
MTPDISTQEREAQLRKMERTVMEKVSMTKIAEPLYYIQDTRSYCGNSVMWWRVDGHGYTSNLEEAWKVPATWKGRDTDKLWPCADIDAGATRQFDMQLLRTTK